MAGLSILVRKEVLEQWRTLRLPVIATIFLLIGLSSPLVARFTPEILKAVGGDQFQLALPPPTTADAVDQLLKNLGQLGALVAVLLPMGTVATEKERGTAALLLTKPASRAAFLLAKLVAIAATLGLAVALAAAGAWFYTLVLFEPLPITGFVAAAALEWLALFAYASVTFLGSALSRSALAAAGLGILGLFGLGIASVLPGIGQWFPGGLGEAARFLALGLPADAWPAIVGSIAIVVVLSLCSWLAFRRQEL
jgi:ABC-2 type transport system permease protein